LGAAIDQYDSIEKLREWIEKNVSEYMKLKEIEKNPMGEEESVSGYIPPVTPPVNPIGPDEYTNREKYYVEQIRAIKKTLNKLSPSLGTLTSMNLESILSKKEYDILEMNIDYIKKQFGFAKGIGSVPYDNFLANLHKDEGVIPGDFMSAINSGELVLSGGKGGAGSTVNNYYSINVEGTVVTENELIEKVHKKTGTMMRRGYVS
jgi:hypothetical protein